MDEEDVDAVHSRALHAVLIGPHDAVIGVVEIGLEREWLLPLVGAVLGAPSGAEPAADLGRHHEAVAIAQDVAEEMLGAAIAVEGGGIEVADTRAERVDDDLAGIAVVDRLHAAGESGSAQSEAG